MMPNDLFVSSYIYEIATVLNLKLNFYSLISSILWFIWENFDWSVVSCQHIFDNILDLLINVLYEYAIIHFTD